MSPTTMSVTPAARRDVADASERERLLDAASTVKGRKELAAATAIPEQQWLDWANNADCMRIKGMGSEKAKLLRRAGVTTVGELSHRNPRSLPRRWPRPTSSTSSCGRGQPKSRCACWSSAQRSCPARSPIDGTPFNGHAAALLGSRPRRLSALLDLRHGTAQSASMTEASRIQPVRAVRSPALAARMAAARTRAPAVMGVLNVTPDSFSDGGKFLHPRERSPRPSG